MYTNLSKGKFLCNHTISAAMTADFYGETFIPEKYARSAYADLFTLEKFFLILRES